MARRRKKTGTCRLCGLMGELSFEHVPPQAAFNKATVIEYTLENWTTKRKVKGRQRQGGVGEYTLCEQCNNDTGSWYADEYIKWSKSAFDILSFMEQYPDHFPNNTEIIVTLKNVYPLRFLKQVITCLFSVVNSSPKAIFAHNNPELARFVLDKHYTHLPQDYQFYLSLYKSSILRHYPIAGKLTLTYEKDKEGSILLHAIGARDASVFSEMAHPPFALVMAHGTGFHGTNITYFKNYGYDEEVDLALPLTLGRSSTPYPGDYQHYEPT